MDDARAGLDWASGQKL